MHFFFLSSGSLTNIELEKPEPPPESKEPFAQQKTYLKGLYLYTASQNNKQDNTNSDHSAKERIEYM